MTNETLADIVREMRTFGERCDHRPFSWQMVDGMFKRLADRIEAAAERELNRLYEPKRDWSIKDALALANTLANHGLRDGNADAASSCIYLLCRMAPGDAAAMRAALTQVQIGFDGNVLGPIGDVPKDWEIAEAKRLCEVVDSALAAPPRNCDVGTADEQEQRFRKFCACYHGGICLGCKVPETTNCDCALAWAQMPYKEGGAE